MEMYPLIGVWYKGYDRTTVITLKCSGGMEEPSSVNKPENLRSVGFFGLASQPLLRPMVIHILGYLRATGRGRKQEVMGLAIHQQQSKVDLARRSSHIEVMSLCGWLWEYNILQICCNNGQI